MSPPSDIPFCFPAQIETRVADPAIGDRIFLRHAEREWTYRHFRNEALRNAHWLLGRLGAIDDSRPGHVAMLLENHLELLSLYAGCAYAGLTLFGVNTGLRGDPLVGVLNQSRARVLVVDEGFYPRVQAVMSRLENLAPENVVVLPSQGGAGLEDSQRLDSCLSSEVGASGEFLELPNVAVGPETNLMVIYTSGTTGLPKGINNNHLKLLAIGMTVAGRLELTPDDCGYACMPLFHSNAIFLGFQPALHAGAALALRERFSASGFMEDVLRYGVTWWNYVGEPVHYILGALQKAYGDDVARMRTELTEHAANRFRFALGNGAAPPDIDRFMDYFGLEDMYELYGSTEAAISTFRGKADPRGSVGEIADDAVKILDDAGAECSPAEFGADGKIANYADAVGEICRVAPDTALFQGYFQNAEANQSKFRGGVYHSGDLGHVMLRDGKRFLFFDGRTDDWIRKDGENFSAAQVARLVQEFPQVALAAAYGAPCAVSDELVMCALTLMPGVAFDPAAFHQYCQEQIEGGSMDPKWLPDFVRVVDEFEYTQTQKILVRALKQEHFDRTRIETDPIYFRERGDSGYRPFERKDFEELRERFRATEREELLER